MYPASTVIAGQGEGLVSAIRTVAYIESQILLVTQGKDKALVDTVCPIFVGDQGRIRGNTGGFDPESDGETVLPGLKSAMDT